MTTVKGDDNITLNNINNSTITINLNSSSSFEQQTEKLNKTTLIKLYKQLYLLKGAIHPLTISLKKRLKSLKE